MEQPSVDSVPGSEAVMNEYFIGPFRKQCNDGGREHNIQTSRINIKLTVYYWQRTSSEGTQTFRNI